MTALFEELKQQPDAMQSLVSYYRESDLISEAARNTKGLQWILTGMGASYHAACIGAFHLNHLGVPALAVEAVDLINYGLKLRKNKHVIVYLSQSGSSAEVNPFLNQLPKNVRLVGITNHPESPLSKNSQWSLNLEAGDEKLIASKTYLNSLALLWILARKAAGCWKGSEWETLLILADRVQGLLKRSEELKRLWVEVIGEAEKRVFLGHGPHAVTARQAAMTLSEWPKLPTLFAGIGAYRHGFIETAKSGMSAVVFAPPGSTSNSAQSLIAELKGYGVKVLTVENGESNGTHHQAPVDEFLSPLLDIIPVQLFADEMAVRLEVPFGFRHLSKVVTQL